MLICITSVNAVIGLEFSMITFSEWQYAYCSCLRFDDAFGRQIYHMFCTNRICKWLKSLNWIAV